MSPKVLTLIGDVHGKFGRYETIIKKLTNTVQVGDMGVGFTSSITGDHYTNPPHRGMVSGNHRFIRGNHDNPRVCSRQSQWIPDGYVETSPSGVKIMYVGGAFSIDRMCRTEGFDWWADEECSYVEFMKIISAYENFKPDIMITHDAPDLARSQMFLSGRIESTRTSAALQNMFDIHQPCEHFFGHWHINKTEKIAGTKFTCLGELSTLELSI